MYQKEIEVNPNHLQSPYNHVHHADLLKIIEKVRIDMFLSLGYRLEDLYHRDLFPVVRSISVEYLREVISGKYVGICQDLSFNKRSMAFKQLISSLNGKKMIVAEIELMFLSHKQKRAVAIPQDIIDSFESVAA